MSWLSDLINAYAEGEGIKQWGPGWREKIAQLQATTKNLGLQGEQTVAETEGIRTRTAGQVTQNTASAEELARIQKKYKVLADKGYMSPEAAAFEADQEAKRLANENQRKQNAVMETPEEATAMRGAKLGEVKAHTGYLNRMPSDGGYGGSGSAGDVVIVNGRPAQRIKGTSMFKDLQSGVLIKPNTPAQEQEIAQLDEAIAQAKALEAAFSGGDLTSGMISGRASKALKNVPIVGSMVASDKDIAVDRSAGAAMLARLYAMTGKQINQTEITRLEQLLPDRSQSPRVAATNARLFREELERIQGRYLSRMQGLGSMTGTEAPLASGLPAGPINNDSPGEDPLVSSVRKALQGQK